MSETETAMNAAAKRSSFVIRHVWSILLVTVLLTASVFYGLSLNRQVSGLRDQEAQITDLKQQLTALQSAENTQLRDVYQDSLGLSLSRISDDRERVEKLLGLAFTWDSGQAYDEARLTIAHDYDLAEDSVFLTAFMPKATYNTDAEGTRYYAIDASGLNSEFSQIVDFGVVSVAGLNYRYTVTADMRVTSDASLSVDSNGNTLDEKSVKRRVLLTVTTDADGNLTDLTGVPASGSTRTSSY